jgi:hypothetical protein
VRFDKIFRREDEFVIQMDNVPEEIKPDLVVRLTVACGVTGQVQRVDTPVRGSPRLSIKLPGTVRRAEVLAGPA